MNPSDRAVHENPRLSTIFEQAITPLSLILAQFEDSHPAIKKYNHKPAAAHSKVGGTGHIDPFSTEMDIKYNIERCNVQDIVFLHQDNDTITQKLHEQEERNARLTPELDALKSRPAFADDLTNSGERAPEPVSSQPAEQDQISDALTKENAELKKRLAKMLTNTAKPENATPAMIPRPAGSAGNNFNIEDAMGLGGCAADHDQYKALLHNVRDLTLQARVNWEQPWAKTPADVKAQLFAVARDRHPYLGRFVNDWATEEIVKQYIKNKRRHGYRQLKANSAKRDQSAPRRKRTFAKVNTAKKASKKKAANSKKASSSKSRTTAKGKAKAKAIINEDVDEDMSDAYGGEEGGDEDD
ncbi:hypothetical protein B0H10DRAFT_2447815 [Mycena sp. CBHHK59/15]|nr:hypothetical protein B0H10DRAFT_2447815 [Mycena sp. CBHHK59/15]